MLRVCVSVSPMDRFGWMWAAGESPRPICTLHIHVYTPLFLCFYHFHLGCHHLLFPHVPAWNGNKPREAPPHFRWDIDGNYLPRGFVTFRQLNVSSHR